MQLVFDHNYPFLAHNDYKGNKKNKQLSDVAALLTLEIHY